MRRVDRRVRRTRKGEYQLRLPAPERELLRSLPSQLRDLLDADDPALVRLFPPAYTDDPAASEEFRGLMHEDLIAGKRSALDVLEKTVDAERVSEEEIGAWLSCLNDLRLVLGTKLDVTEDMDEPLDPGDPRAAAFGLYHYLGFLEEHVVEALSEGVDPRGSRTHEA